jgi:hypothetical protein
MRGGTPSKAKPFSNLCGGAVGGLAPKPLAVGGRRRAGNTTENA